MFDLELLRDLKSLDILSLAALQTTQQSADRMANTVTSSNPYLSAYLSRPFVGATNVPPAPRISRSAQSPFMYGGRFIESDWRVRMEMRLAAVSIGVQLYRADHGDWPASLQVLVPQYMPSIPKDPYSELGKPIGYLLVPHALPDGRDRPLIYSVSSAGDTVVDGTYVLPVPQYDWERGSIQFRDLARWSPAPATQPAK